MQNCMTWDIFFDYIRMVSYVIVVLTSLRGILVRKFTNILFIGDIIVAIALFITLYNSTLLGRPISQSADIFITPVAVVWACIHFYSMCRDSKVA